MFPSPWDKEIPCELQDLEPVRVRLREAVELDIDAPGPNPAQALAAAWSRISELRLPGWCLPKRIRDEVDELVLLWDRQRGPGGIARAAQALDPARVQTEANRIRMMLDEIERAIRVLVASE